MGFKDISFSDSLRLGIRLSEYQQFCRELIEIFEIRQDFGILYVSENPDEEFLRYFVG
jgi:hypothetical protein